ncbi:S-adenosyl-L-methionine-dependent methyltransferase [Mytilinidion resinicola]|uniref:DNA (cytosine-5-)-methyltransferase n=1 Tax=Mytilinidion resinicola TaxID=574789 RepID=A0A6A6YGG2_9PEZI|nr:S-adenosyl-L-methionine-dependent methyltransferase [Mytilinidion resinicola]KAF2807830.1 S-adenosyl-L-methionine-dependent methyltransferase [Mytilinidion resinicola]
MSSKKGHVVVTPSDFTHPKSLFEGWTPPLAVTEECTAVEELREVWNAMNPGVNEVTFRLEHFSVYRPNGTHSNGELEPLIVLRAKYGVNKLLCDGILACGDQRRWVQGVEFLSLSIEGYDDRTIPAVNVYIKSRLCQHEQECGEQDTWFLLGEPAPEYYRYHHNFLWIANFGRYFIDYLNRDLDVCLDDFREHFYSWVKSEYKDCSEWLAESGRKDFRMDVAAYVDYLYHESGLVNNDHADAFIWKECMSSELAAIKERKQRKTKTICTELVHEHFVDTYFGQKLAVQKLAPEVAKARELRMTELGFTKDSTESQQENPSTSINPKSWKPSKGDFVSVKRDEGSVWKGESDGHFAYVRDTSQDAKGELLLRVIWLYLPEETVIFSMKYLHKNELFFSDHCNCHDPHIRASDILGRAQVLLNPKTIPRNDQLFVQQTYSTETNSFTTFRLSDMSCSCSKKRKSVFEEVEEKYSRGDCVYVLKKKGKSSEDDMLEPMVIECLDSETGMVGVRHLARRARDCQHNEDPAKDWQSRPNELVWTNTITSVRADLIRRRCHVRYFDSETVERGDIPVPYNRDGTVDCWYFCVRLVDGQLRRFKSPPSFNQGFDQSNDKKPKMKGMSLFTGGGSFDRGLEECGAIETVVAVDFSKSAAHTFRANLNGRPTGACIFCGSVDDHLSRVLSGDPKFYGKAKIGDIDFVSAGSPCPGFSTMQNNKLSSRSLTNASHVTSFPSYVDLYRPKYAILENVLGIATGVGKDNVLSQLVGCLVSMGYQVQVCIGDGWSHGDPQSRSRLFIICTAPGLQPPAPLVPTHSHPGNLGDRSFGNLPNGQRFGKRDFGITPFRYISTKMATKDLPNIGDSRVQICIPFPDHRHSATTNFADRRLMSLIPINSSLMAAIALEREINHKQGPDDEGTMEMIPKFYKKRQERFSKDRQNPNPKVNRCWARLDEEGLFPTVKTGICAGSSRYGKVLHSGQPRMMTIQEARRAQGIPDHEVIIGTPEQQWSIIGNGVTRSVGLAWGFAFREAWLSDNPEEKESWRIEITQQHSSRGVSRPELDLAEDVQSMHLEEDEPETTVTEEISVHITRVERSTTTGTYIDQTTSTTVNIRSHAPTRPDASCKGHSTKVGLSKATENQTAPEPEKKTSSETPINGRKRARPQLNESQKPRKRTRQNTAGTELVAPDDYSQIPEKLSRKSIRTETRPTNNDGDDDDEDEGPLVPRSIWKRPVKTNGIRRMG